MKWIEIAFEYCSPILISSLEQKKAIFSVKYEIVLRTAYFKARCPPPLDLKEVQNMPGLIGLLLLLITNQFITSIINYVNSFPF